MIEEINSWLNSDREYFAGCSLYEQYGTSFQQKRLLRMGGPTKKNREILEYELQRLVKNSVVRVNTSAQVSKPVAPAAPKLITKPSEPKKKTKLQGKARPKAKARGKASAGRSTKKPKG